MVDKCGLPGSDRLRYRNRWNSCGYHEGRYLGACIIWLRAKCNTSFLKGDILKFCRTITFRFGATSLSCTKSHGKSITRSRDNIHYIFNLYEDQRRFTRGKTITFWSDVSQAARSLLRTLIMSAEVCYRCRQIVVMFFPSNSCSDYAWAARMVLT